MTINIFNGQPNIILQYLTTILNIAVSWIDTTIVKEVSTNFWQGQSEYNYEIKIYWIQFTLDTVRLMTLHVRKQLTNFALNWFLTVKCDKWSWTTKKFKVKVGGKWEIFWTKSYLSFWMAFFLKNQHKKIRRSWPQKIG